MSDYDDEPGSGSSLLWYAAGRSSGYSSGEFDAQQQHRRQEARDERAGLIKVRSADVDRLAKNRDDLWEQGTQLVRQTSEQAQYIAELEAALEQAQGQISSLKNEHYWTALELRNKAADFEQEVGRLRQSLQAKDTALSETEAKLRTALNFGRGLDKCCLALMKAAEQGKTDRPEYDQLKADVQFIRDEWSRRDPHEPPLTAAFLKLLEALER